MVQGARSEVWCLELLEQDSQGYTVCSVVSSGLDGLVPGSGELLGSALS